MGLESMPSVHREKVKNISSRENYDDKASKPVVIHRGLGIEEKNLGKGQVRRERPQKLQKTGLSKTQAVTKYVSEARQIKGVLSQSRKQNPMKLASPVKNARISSSKNVSHKSRLIGVATRILEPGLQGRNGESSALTYSESMHYASGYDVIVDSSATEKTPYIKCRPVLNKSIVSQYMDDHTLECNPASSSSGFSNAPCQDSVGNKMNIIVPVADTEKAFSTIRQEESISLKGGKRFPSQCPKTGHLPTKKSAPHRDDPSSIATMRSGRVFSGASSASVKKDFVALNRSLSGQTRPRVLSKDESSSIDATRRSRGRRYDSVSHLRSPVRRMMTASSDEPVRNMNLCTSATGRLRKVTSATVPGNGKSDDRSSVISFTFNSPLKQNTSSYTEAEDRKSNKSCSVRENDDMENCSLEASDKKAYFRNHLAVRGDALGALLEQKLKELMYQEDEDSTSGSTALKRSTGMILQELIAALTADPTLSQDCDMLNTDEAVQVSFFSFLYCFSIF